MIADKRLIRLLAVRDIGGLSDRQIAHVIRVRPTTIREWLAGHSAPTDVQTERLTELFLVVERLARLLDATSISLWLNTLVPALGEAKPIDRIAAGDNHTVVRLISGLEDPGAS